MFIGWVCSCASRTDLFFFKAPHCLHSSGNQSTYFSYQVKLLHSWLLITVLPIYSPLDYYPLGHMHITFLHTAAAEQHTAISGRSSILKRFTVNTTMEYNFKFC